MKPCPNCKEEIKECACMRNKCIKCGKAVGNITFTICDECFDIKSVDGVSSEVDEQVMPGGVSDEGKRRTIIKLSLLEVIYDDLKELLSLNEWRRNTTKLNRGYIECLEKEIADVKKILDCAQV